MDRKKRSISNDHPSISPLKKQKVREQKSSWEADNHSLKDEGESPEVDMFASSSSSATSPAPSKRVNSTQTISNNETALENSNLGRNGRKAIQDDVDDLEGYYLVRNGEYLGMNEEYLVLGSVGRGVFSNVVLCSVQKNKRSDINLEKVAIKLIRNNASMKRAGFREISVLEKIKALNVKNTFIVRLLDHFEHRKHLCLVFEPMKLNLREVLYQYGRNVGLNFNAVKIYAKQLLTALSYLWKLKIVHADFKLDNILVSEKLGLLKLCDFGTAFYEDDPNLEPTPYLVSRYYRPPEIILGLKYSMKIDIWALGCCLFELYTGNILFKGETNNKMLFLFQQTKGRIGVKMVRKYLANYFIIRKVPHFDPETLKFREISWDKAANELVTKDVIFLDKPANPVTQRLLKQTRAASVSEREVKMFGSLIDQCLGLDPLKRVNPEQALRHKLFEDSK